MMNRPIFLYQRHCPPDTGNILVRGESSMKLTVKILDIATRRGVLLNRLDARSIGVLDGDRVQIINPKNGVAVTAVVATTTTLEGQGAAGVYRPTNQRLNLAEGEQVEIQEADRRRRSILSRKRWTGAGSRKTRP